MLSLINLIVFLILQTDTWRINITCPRFHREGTLSTTLCTIVNQMHTTTFYLTIAPYWDIEVATGCFKGRFAPPSARTWSLEFKSYFKPSGENLQIKRKIKYISTTNYNARLLGESWSKCGVTTTKRIHWEN